ncbi:DNA-binding protein [Streptococcus ruminicola]|uniref:YobI family P-loop NTPase n=1 Tax=Streptococcus ruminicola TaxID=2686210 RepID=UPI0024146121|nr:DNA-binding protein [Streptococcus ruminicola]WFM80904.1 DNA-binding protein [Streptococcus ruminicola]
MESLDKIKTLFHKMKTKMLFHKNNTEQDKDVVNFEFKKLTPLNDIDIDKSYVAAMKFALEEDDIKNVAIAGNYGSGKSSFIETYKEINKNFKPIHISLAHFSALGDGKEKIDVSEEQNQSSSQVNLIEGKVINQLLHQTDSKNIPLTVFKSKKNPEKSEHTRLSRAILGIILPTLFLLNYNSLVELAKKTFSIPPFNVPWPWVKLIIIVIMIFTVIIDVNRLSKLQLEKHFIKNISIQSKNISGDIELFQDVNCSYFDKYLDDVLYLFDNCGSNVIIFEDIDRFETNLIFEKLREINTLVNNKRKSADKILFIYLIKDDMFTSNDRTKFFDFIIPMIPVITSSNSVEKITEMLAEKNNVSKGLLKQLSIYVDDMRLAYNIYNEFILYKNNLLSQEKEENDKENSKLSLSEDKLFAIIVYKNIFPKDFSLLQKDKGFVYQLFHQIDSLKQENLKKKAKKIEELKEKISSAEQEFCENKIELYSMFMKIPEGRACISVNDRFESDFSSRLEFIQEILSDDAKIVSYARDYYRRLINPEQEMLSSIFPIEDSNFKERLNSLENKNRLEEFNNDLELLRKKYEELKNEKLAKLINRDYFDNIISSDSDYEYLKKDSKVSLILYLIRNGYLDENYPNYITYFYANSLKKQDQEFIMAVQGEKQLDPNYDLVNIGEVNNRLSDSDFENVYVLNYDLFSYILLIADEHRIKSFLSEYNVQFINEFFQQMEIDMTAKLGAIRYMIKLNQNTLKLLISTDNRKEKYIIIVLMLSCINLSTSDLQDDLQETILEFVNSEWAGIQEFIDNFNSPIDEGMVENNLKYIEAKLKQFSFDDSRKSMSDFVYNNNLYEINYDNISSLIFYLGGDDLYSQFKNRPITAIKKYDKLSEYVNDNKELYISRILPSIKKDFISDDLEDSYDILNCDDLTLEAKKIYLDKIPNHKLNGDKIFPDMFEFALKSKKIKCDTKNIIDSFKWFDGWSLTLVTFVNTSEKFSFKREVFNEYETYQKELFFIRTANCDELENTKYEEILSKLGMYFSELGMLNISEEKMSILIKTKSISKKFNLSILEFLRANYQNHVIQYLKTYIESYLEFDDTQDVEDNYGDIYHESELLELLEENISEEDKKKVIDHFDNGVSISNKSYSLTITNYILENKFDESDLEYLLANYDNLDEPTKRITESIFSEWYETVLTEKYPINKHLLYAVLNNEEVNVEKRKLILSEFLSEFTDSEVVNLLKVVGLDTIIIAINGNGKRPRIQKTNYNKKILDYLDKNNKISTYSEHGEYYQINSYKNN